MSDVTDTCGQRPHLLPGVELLHTRELPFRIAVGLKGRFVLFQTEHHLLVRALLPLLDGTRTVEECEAALAGQLGRPVRIRSVVDAFDRNRLLARSLSSPDCSDIVLSIPQFLAQSRSFTCLARLIMGGILSLLVLVPFLLPSLFLFGSTNRLDGGWGSWLGLAAVTGIAGMLSALWHESGHLLAGLSTCAGPGEVGVRSLKWGRALLMTNYYYFPFLAKSIRLFIALAGPLFNVCAALALAGIVIILHPPFLLLLMARLVIFTNLLLACSALRPQSGDGLVLFSALVASFSHNTQSQEHFARGVVTSTLLVVEGLLLFTATWVCGWTVVLLPLTGLLIPRGLWVLSIWSRRVLTPCNL